MHHRTQYYPLAFRSRYHRGMAMFGEQTMVELISAVGFFSMVACR